MPTIVLLVAPTILPDDELVTSTQALAGQLGAKLIVTDEPNDITHESVDLVLWMGMPGPLDEEIYQQLQQSCSKIILLAHLKRRTGRFATPGGLQVDYPNIITAVAPFYDIEEMCLLIKSTVGWPPTENA